MNEIRLGSNQKRFRQTNKEYQLRINNNHHLVQLPTPNVSQAVIDLRSKVKFQTKVSRNTLAQPKRNRI